MSGQTPSSTAPPTWCLSEFVSQQHSAALTLTLATALAAFFAGWVLRPIIAEYIKAWHFLGVPPWRYKPTTVKEIERREKAVQVREHELQAHMATFEALLSRAEGIEAANIALKVENAKLHVRIRKLSEPRCRLRELLRPHRS